MSQHIWGESETQFFYSLTPDIILEAIEKIGFETTGRCLQLASMENRVYEIEIEVDEATINSPSERFLVAKFYRPGRWSREQILDEHRFLLDLETSEVPVIAPIEVDGETLFELTDSKLFYSIFPKKGGRAPQEMSNEELQILGRQIARMHIVGTSRESEHRLELSTENFVDQNLAYLLENQKIPFHLESRYKDLAQEVSKLSAPLFDGIKKHRIHGDCHWGNVISRAEEGMFFIDFDDMLVGPSVQDIWLIIPYAGDEGRRQRDEILNAYETMKHFDDKELKLIEPLRTFRFIHFSAWIAKRWSDPAFQRAFPQYAEDRYWEEQVRDLETQIQKF